MERLGVGGSSVAVQCVIQPAPARSPVWDCLDRTRLTVPAIKQAGLTRELSCGNDRSIGQLHLGPGGEISACLDDAVIAQGNAGSGIRAQQAALSY